MEQPQVPAPVPTAPPVLRVVRSDDEVVEPAAPRTAVRRTSARTPAPVGSDQAAPGRPDETDDAAASGVPPGAAGPARTRRAAGQRASVPDWADVLLGTAPARLPERGRAPESS